MTSQTQQPAPTGRTGGTGGPAGATPSPSAAGPGPTPGPGGAARFQQVPVQAPRHPLVAVGSAVGLLALLVGVPGVLVAVGGVPALPTSAPDGGLLTARIGVEQVVSVLLVVVWLAWLQFAFCTVVEVVAALRGGVLATSVPLSGPVQRLARGLVAGLLLTATLGTQVGAGAMPPPAPTAVVAVDTGVRPSPLAPVGADLTSPDGAGAMLWTEPAVDVTPDGADAGRSVTVLVPTSVLGGAVDADRLADLVGQKVYVVAPPQGRHHDSLWDIAERHLGDGRRYTEIYALNRDRVQPDGRSLELARLIQPGWYLVMPDDAVGVERMAAPAPAWPGTGGASSSGSSSSGSSAGASDASGPMSGLGGGAGIVTDGASGAVGGSGLGGSGLGGSGLGGAGVLGTSSDGPAVPGTGEGPVPGPTSAPSTPAPAPTATASDGTDPGLLAGELGAAGLLGAGLLAALLAARRRGRPAAPPDAAVEAEVWLRAGADPGRARFVDTALRSLAAACADEGTPFPDVYAVVADDDAVTLLLAPPRPTAPAPWTAAPDGAQWVLPRGLLPRSTGHVGPPLPSLVGLGRDADGRDVLVDLAAAAGPVSVTGDPVVAGHVARALAIELATNPWSRDVRVTGVDLPAGLSVVGGIDVPADPADPLAGLRARVAPSASDDVLTGPPDRGGRAREHVVLGRPPEHLVREDLRRLGAGGTLGVVVAGDVPGARWRFEVTADGALTVGELALAVTANRIGDATLGRLGELFAAAAGPLDAATPDGTTGGAGDPSGDPSGAAAPFAGPDDGDDVRFYAHVPASPHPTADGAWADAPARIGVLGPVVVRAPGALDAARVDLAAEVVAYLALHPQGAHPTVLAGAVWPRGVTPDVRDATLARVADWLGEGPAGPRLVVGDDERLRLGPEVAVDHHVLCELLRQAGRAVGTPAERDLLVRALSLVRGPLAGGVTGGAYSWLPRTGLERTVPQLVTAAAHRLAVLTGSDDPRAAGEAARCGLRADPCSQVVWRDLLRSEHAQWGADGARQAAVQMREVLADLGAAPDALTEALVDELCPGAGRQVVGGA